MEGRQAIVVSEVGHLGRARQALSSLLLNGATMSQQSSLTQSAHSVRQVLTAYTARFRGVSPEWG